MCDSLFHFGRIYNQAKELGVRGGSHMTHICDALRDLVPFIQFEKREKYSWKSVTFIKVAGLLKVTLFHGCFLRFLNCTNGTKSRKAPHGSQVAFM